MFKREVKEKKKITPGLLIAFGFFLMSMVVIINDSGAVDTAIENLKVLSQQ